MLARVTDGSGAQAVRIFSGSRRDGATPSILFFTSVIAATLAVALPHAHVTANTDSASLVGNSLAEGSAFHQSRELLGAEDVEGLCLDFHSPVNTWGEIGFCRLQVKVLGLLGRFEQAEGEAEVALVSDGEVGEDEVSSLSRSVEIGHARRRNTSQDGRVVGSAILDTAMGNGTGLLQARIKEEIGVVVESDVLAFFNGGTLDNAKFNNGRRINGSSVAVCYEGVSKKMAFWKRRRWRRATHHPPATFKIVPFIPEPHARARSGCCRTVNWYQR